MIASESMKIKLAMPRAPTLSNSPVYRISNGFCANLCYGYYGQGLCQLAVTVQIIWEEHWQELKAPSTFKLGCWTSISSIQVHLQDYFYSCPKCYLISYMYSQHCFLRQWRRLNCSFSKINLALSDFFGFRWGCPQQSPAFVVFCTPL